MKRTKAISLPSAQSFRNAEQQESLDLPERVLWAGVLREAFFDLQRKEQDWRRSDAARWIASDKEYIGSFRFCCDAVGLAPSAIRRAVKGESLAKISAWRWHRADP